MASRRDDDPPDPALTRSEAARIDTPAGGTADAADEGEGALDGSAGVGATRAGQAGVAATQAGEAGVAATRADSAAVQGARAVDVVDDTAPGVECERIDVERLRRLAVAVLDDLRVPADMAVDVVCVGSGEMADLNAAHMDGDGPTDVLAFPLDSPGEVPSEVPAILGDVVLCPEVAAAQAVESGVSAAAELDMLMVHGLLHLLGFDHEEPEERREMFALTDRLLASYGQGAP